MEFSELIPIAILAAILVVAWIALKTSLKITATLFRIGCLIIFLIVAGGFVIAFLR
jgi:hypothetical protein